MHQRRWETDKEINPELDILIDEIIQALFETEDILYHGNWTPPIHARGVRDYLFGLLPESTREEIKEYVRNNVEDPRLREINRDIQRAISEHNKTGCELSTALMIRDYLINKLPNSTRAEILGKVNLDEH